MDLTSVLPKHTPLKPGIFSPACAHSVGLVNNEPSVMVKNNTMIRIIHKTNSTSFIFRVEKQKLQVTANECCSVVIVL